MSRHQEPNVGSNQSQSGSEAEDEIMPRVAGVLEGFYESVLEQCMIHMHEFHSDVYQGKHDAVLRLEEIITDFEISTGFLRKLVIVLAIVPSRHTNGRMKEFARTRSFRMLSQMVHQLADEIEELEDIWNDLPAADAAKSEAPQERPSAPTQEIEPPRHSRRKGPC